MSWAIFVLLGGVYLLTYRGLFHSIDELALYCLTESMVQTRSLHTPQLEFSRYHNRVGRLEPLHSALATPLYWAAVYIDHLGNEQAVMLLNVPVTAATAGLLYLLLLEMGHSPGHALGATLAYGLGTMAWPYSRTFFREPLLALLLTLATLCFVHWRQKRSLGWGIATVGFMLMMPLVKVTAVMLWPAFGLAFVLEENIPRHARIQRLWSTLTIGAVGILVGSLMYTLRIGHLPSPSLLRGWSDTGVVLQRVFGLTLSAGRGVVLFVPLTLPAVMGTWALWRRRRTEGLLVITAWTALLIGYGGYGSWHAGMSWGPRFLVPLMPLLALPVAEWLSRPGRWTQATGAAFIGLSFVVQAAASTAEYSLQVEAEAWNNMTDYARSPVVQQLALWRADNLDMLWWHSPASPRGDVTGVLWAAAVPLLLSIAGAVGALLHRGRVARRWACGATLCLGWGMVALLIHTPDSTAGYPGVISGDLRQVAAIVNRPPGEPRVIVTVSNEYHLNLLMSYFKGRFVHYWFSPLQKDNFESLLYPPLDARRLRLIVDRVHLPPDCSGRELELWLNARLYRYFVDWVGDGYQVYSYLYPPDRMSLQAVDYRWAAGMRMMVQGVTPHTLSPGEPLWVELHFTADRRPAADYDIFLQLLGPDGHFVNGTDGPPQFGGAPTRRWVPGTTVVDRRALFVPDDVPAGEYRLVTGFYRGSTRDRVCDENGVPIGDHVELAVVQVRHR